MDLFFDQQAAGPALAVSGSSSPLREMRLLWCSARIHDRPFDSLRSLRAFDTRGSVRPTIGSGLP